MNIFLTGATGFVGSFLAEALLRQGHRMFALVRGVDEDIHRRYLHEHERRRKAVLRHPRRSRAGRFGVRPGREAETPPPAKRTATFRKWEARVPGRRYRQVIV